MCVFGISCSLATTFVISEPSYEVNKSSGHQELSVDTLTITLWPLIQLQMAETYQRTKNPFFPPFLPKLLKSANIKKLTPVYYTNQGVLNIIKCPYFFDLMTFEISLAVASFLGLRVRFSHLQPNQWSQSVGKSVYRQLLM